MKVPPEYDTVEKFLDELRAICGLIPHIQIILRPKNIEFIERSGLTQKEIEDIIFNKLNKNHLRNGPELERNKNHKEGIIYTFRYQWQGYDIYIKLKIIIGDRPYAICLSFHD